MTLLKLPYGRSTIEAEVPDRNLLAVVGPREAPATRSGEEEVKSALDNPAGSDRIEDIVERDHKVAVLVNDITRPAPTKTILQELMFRLKKARVRRSDITIVVATGTHRSSSRADLVETLGHEIVRDYEIIDHNCHDAEKLIGLGKTKRGVPVKINKVVAQSQVKILTGLIAPHQAAGFSGGRKSVAPGVSGGDTIAMLHSFPIQPREPVMGMLSGNQFHEEIEEAAKIAGIGFIVNTVFNTERKIVGAFAGDLVEAWTKGTELCRRIYTAEVPHRAEIVVAVAGGYPRDINLYQAQKAIASAERVVTHGGAIILTARCEEGLGSGVYFEWLRQASRPEEVIERFEREAFTEGAMKAYFFARALQRAKLSVVSDGLSCEQMREISIVKSGSLEEAVNAALDLTGPDAGILVLNHADELIPVLRG